MYEQAKNFPPWTYIMKRIVQNMWRKKCITLKKKNLLILISIVVLSCIGILFQSDFAPDLYFMYRGPLENISCHYIEDDDALPSAEDPFFYPPPNSIYFHETSCSGNLNSRQACAVESVARTHKSSQVYVFFSSPISVATLNSGRLKILSKLNNVYYARVHLIEYVKGTGLESIVSGGVLNRSRFKVVHTSDMLRYVTLYKYGGTYFDLDVVVTIPLGPLPKNWAARESNSTVSAAVLKFSRDKVGRRVAKAALSDIKLNFNGDMWGTIGPGTITRVLQGICSTRDPNAMSSDTCDGFEVYGPEFFYPIDWSRKNFYFEKANPHMPQAYMFHIWNKDTKQLKVYKGSPYANLAKNYCPSIYESYKEDFGDYLGSAQTSQ